MIHIVALLMGIAVLWFVLNVLTAQKQLHPKILDTKQIERTEETEHSSYDQRTNHMPYASVVEQVSGMATPFRVNAYTAVR
jgi:hypothetical protein